MRAEYEGYNNGHLEWSDCPYMQSNSNIHHWDYQCKGNTQVREIANALYSKGRERYDLQGGKGCRFWIYVAGKDFADQGIITGAAPTEIWGKVQFLYHHTNAPEQTAVVQGKFY
ncbi:uncharacterized protein HMPREF1541_00036 [Cyphellophora europaea CBS 101466]|uniref:DUF7770 domain-containing protein n=1 Tax=Cyphellophora europaea (strain CBS 101466) TaxID=1220924 RepID=W2SB61_CYPE1|nr:uncharacterized protein HMPREF1541_00036 [Cyphellophora europaea CBS 101466]ETN45855.1 hypothetical protein HMPREF1541_00036 [Cyphellophora europaea CBS 101466]